MSKFLNSIRKLLVVGILWLTTRNHRFKIQVKRVLYAFKRALEAETDETRMMVQIYLKSTQGRATKEDLKLAHHQFRDLLKSLGLGALLILPFAPLTLPLLVAIGKRLGVEVLPGFLKKFEDEKRGHLASQTESGENKDNG